MATVNKSDRKKLINTQVIGALVVFARADTGEEICRVNVDDVSSDIGLALRVYGAKQIVADIVSQADGIEAKAKGMAAACDALASGQWPRRVSAASLEPAIAMLMTAQGISREAAMELLGLG